jgi:hypothetical protein
VKRSDISDEHVLELCRAWQRGIGAPGALQALLDEGVPHKVGLAKIYHMADRGLVEWGVSAAYPWPVAS